MYFPPECPVWLPAIDNKNRTIHAQNNQYSRELRLLSEPDYWLSWTGASAVQFKLQKWHIIANT